MSVNDRPFTTEEDMYIVAHYDTDSYAEIARVLGRTRCSVKSRAYSVLHLRKGTGNRVYFTPEENDYILEHYQSESWPTIAKHLGRTTRSVQKHANSYLNIHRRTTERAVFTQEEDEWLKEMIPKYLFRDIVVMFEEKFGKKITVKQLHTHNMKKLRVISGRQGNQNKAFRAENYKPIGYEVIYPNGYTFVKVSDTGDQNTDYKSKQYVEYEKYHGTVPENYIVIFLDGNRNNFDINNLYALDKRISGVLNNKQLRTNCDKDLTLAAIKTWELHYAIIDNKNDN